MFKSRIGNGLFRKQSRGPARLNKERANLSFMFVVMFLAVFGIIVLTEVLLIDEKGRGQGVQVRKGLGGRRFDRSDYEDQAEDYLIYHDRNFDVNLAAFLGGDLVARPNTGKKDREGRLQDGVNVANVESRLPALSVNHTARDGQWQAVQGTRSKFLLFSAFYDKRYGRSIRIIGATKTRGPDRVWCRLWYNTTAGNKTTLTSFSVPAQFKMIRENWNLRYSACFVICPLKHNLTVPGSVSVVPRLRTPPSNHLLVRHLEKDQELVNRTESLAVCVKPLHYAYDKAVQLLEFLELYRILGVEHFTLYNHTIGPSVECILQDYMDKGLVTLLPWQLDMKSQKEIRTEGLFAALNDCLYRSMFRYSYVAMIDLDEFILPRHNETLMDLIRWMGTRIHTKNTGSFSLQNAFFYLQWEDDPLVTASGFPLATHMVTMKKTRRKTKLHPHKQRSKYICRPELVVEAGNHFVWEFLPGHGTVNVPADAAILHHYRVCEFGGNDCVKTASVVDRTAYRYKDKLIHNVELNWNRLQPRCNLLLEPPH